MTLETSSFDVEVSIKDFVAALSILTSVIERKSVNPVLSCVKLETEGCNLIIQATDGSIFIKHSIGAKIQQGAVAVTVDGKLLERMLKGLADGSLNLRLLEHSNELLINTSSFELKLVIMSTDEFPKFPRIYTDTCFEISCKDLSNLIHYTEFSSSKDEIRYNLNGVCLHSNGDGRIHSASTDVFRLSTFFIEAPDHKKEFKIILPSKTVDFIKSLGSPFFENHIVKTKTNNNIIEFAVLNTLIVSKLIDGSFPEYQGLIPQNNVNVLKIKRSIFASAIERVAGISDEKSKAIKININTQNIEISAYTQSKGEAKQQVGGDFFNYEGIKIEIAFQPKYLIDILNLIKNQEDVEVEVLLKDSSSPVVITCSKLQNALFVVMPIKI